MNSGGVYQFSNNWHYSLPRTQLRFLHDEVQPPMIATSSHSSQDLPTTAVLLDDAKPSGDEGTQSADDQSAAAQPAVADGTTEAEIARKIAMIRQDLATFGIDDGMDGDKLREVRPEMLEYFAA